MADNTKIEWTDATWNPITGCSVVSPGCTNCYAMKLAGARLRHHPTRAGLTREAKASPSGARTKSNPVWNGEVRFNEKQLREPLGWKRARNIFVCAHGDLFHESVPDSWIDQVFAVMALCPQHTFQVLTKRPDRMREYLSSSDRNATDGSGGIIAGTASRIFFRAALNLAVRVRWPLRNVWLGTSVEDQRRADERIPHLLATPAAIRFLSAEPLLGPVDLMPYLLIYTHADDELLLGDAPIVEPLPFHDPATTDPADIATPRLDWVIVGGESGPGARPMHPDWARALRDQCAAAGVPFLFKQWGEWAPGNAFGMTGDGPLTDRWGNVGDWMRRYVVCGDDRADRLTAHSFTEHATNLVYHVGKKRAGRLLDGVEHDGFPVVA